MPSITERIQAVITSALGVTPSMYTGDWHKYMDAQSIAAGQLNERQIALANTLSGSSLNSSTALIYLQSYFLRQQNLLTFSELFDNAAWTKSGVTVTANATTSPDGAATADKLVESATSAAHAINQNVASLAANIVSSGSVFAKAGERRYLQVRLFSNATSTNLCRVTYDLLTGTVTETVNGGTASGAQGSIVLGSQGFYRCSISGIVDTVVGTGVTHQVFLMSAPTGTTIYLGDGTSGLYVWGAQLNTGPFALEYSRTDASALP